MNNAVNEITNPLPSSLEKNHDIVVNTCNDSIPKNKVSKQTQEESANDSLNNEINDISKVLLSSLEKNHDKVVNTSIGTIIKTKKRKTSGFRPSVEYIARQKYSRRFENHERLLKNLKRSMCGTSFIKETKINSESIMQLPTKSINDFVVEAEKLSRQTKSESIMQIPTNSSRTILLNLKIYEDQPILNLIC